MSKPYEERRAYATPKKEWPEVEFVAASARTTFEEYVNSIGDPRLVIDMLVGALQRLLIYPDHGFMIKLPVPDQVTDAYQRLCRGVHQPPSKAKRGTQPSWICMSIDNFDGAVTECATSLQLGAVEGYTSKSRR